MTNKTNEIASKYLGKKTDGSELYDPSLLVAIPRFENREQYEIQNDCLPFDGADVWHAYEFSVMTQNGVPSTRLMKMKYNCDSEFLVESKSMKLYLNSFNMTRLGENIEECLNLCRKMIEKDLSDVLKTPVQVCFLDNNSSRTDIFKDFKDIMTFVNESTLKIEKFKEAPELIELDETKTSKEYFLTFDSLRSNCRVTHQPDFGDAFIFYKSKKHIKEDSLVKYLCSFRSEFHFHEECCEMIFKRLYDLLDKDDELFVSILYTRRGGIDICPVRYTHNCKFNDFYDLADVSKYARNTIKQ